MLQEVTALAALYALGVLTIGSIVAAIALYIRDRRRGE
jgi:hypothetical protein